MSFATERFYRHPHLKSQTLAFFYQYQKKNFFGIRTSFYYGLFRMSLFPEKYSSLSFLPHNRTVTVNLHRINSFPIDFTEVEGQINVV